MKIMKVGIPKSLLYYKYYPFIETFFRELGAEVVLSRDTNKEILNNGVKYCVDEACLPMKVFHGHVLDIMDKCDLIFIPRVMQLYKGEFICPKFCGLPEMVINSIPDLPIVLKEPLYGFPESKLRTWAFNTGKYITRNPFKIKRALKSAIEAQRSFKPKKDRTDYKINIALAGHPYTIHDSFINMNLKEKLNKLGIGVITAENVDTEIINGQIKSLFKRPFWTFAREEFGFTTYLKENSLVDGIVYVSSFGCGIDSIVIELIKEKTGAFPFLMLKIDEETGEAGFDTRIEAFSDMLERRCRKIEDNIS
jgi:predicted nucleotide-binding protein (sugar kinase/HSP70/actin superfamily)